MNMTWVIHPYTRYVCAACVCFACIVATYEIRCHAVAYDYPRLQIHIVRIILMVPFYGILTLLALFFPAFNFFIVTIRDTYEAFVLYTFICLLIQYCGGQAQLIRSLNMKTYKGMHPWPFTRLKMFALDRAFFLRCKRYVLQYALIKPVGSAIACIGAPLEVYREADFNFATNLYPWLYCINNVSISYSLYYLVLFHIEVEKELSYCKPGLKFVTIKSIIFFAFWQSATIGILVGMGWLYTGEGEEREVVNSAIQGVLMCIELAPVSLLHHFAFGQPKLAVEMAEEPSFSNDEGGRFAASSARGEAKEKSALNQALNLADFVKDTLETIFSRTDRLVEDSGDGDEEMDDVGAAGGAAGGDPHMAVAAHLFDLYAESSGDDDDESVASDPADYEPYEPLRDFDALSSNAVVVDEATGGANADGPATFCVVCGRFDRPLVTRNSGTKCRECVGQPADPLLRLRRLDVHADDGDESCVRCGHTNRVMVRRGGRQVCTQCLILDPVHRAADTVVRVAVETVNQAVEATTT